MHHLLLAHGTAVGRLRELSSGRADVGIVLNLFGVHAADGAAPAVERAVERIDLMQNQVWLDALLHGTYGDAVRELAPPAVAELVHDGDLQVIAAPLDWLGVNYYADLEFEQSAHQPAPVSGAPARDAVRTDGHAATHCPRLAGAAAGGHRERGRVHRPDRQHRRRRGGRRPAA
jgi:beta-glucosidase